MVINSSCLYFLYKIKKEDKMPSIPLFKPFLSAFFYFSFLYFLFYAPYQQRAPSGFIPTVPKLASPSQCIKTNIILWNSQRQNQKSERGLKPIYRNFADSSRSTSAMQKPFQGLATRPSYS